MNPVFWLLVLLALAVIYFLGAFIFPKIGAIAVKAYHNFQKAISEEPQPQIQNPKEIKENDSNEG